MYNCTAECNLSILSHLVHSGWKRERDESRRGKCQHQFASISSNKSAVHPQTFSMPVTVHLHVCLAHLCHQPDSGCSPQGWSTRIWTQLLLTLAAASRTSSPTHRHWRALHGRKREERRGSNGGRRGIEGGSMGDRLEKEKRGEREGREVQGKKREAAWERGTKREKKSEGGGVKERNEKWGGRGQERYANCKAAVCEDEERVREVK